MAGAKYSAIARTTKARRGEARQRVLRPSYSFDSQTRQFANSIPGLSGVRIAATGARFATCSHLMAICRLDKYNRGMSSDRWPFGLHQNRSGVVMKKILAFVLSAIFVVGTVAGQNPQKP